MHTRMDVIKTFIQARGYTRYLEIGCRADDCFREIEVTVKVGVDPNTGGTVRMTSDEYFQALPQGVLFDAIFIDGDHRHPQVWTDIQNSLAVLQDKGVLFMHDCLPPSAEYESPSMCGTAWRAFAKLRERPDLDAYVANLDYGVGIIQKRPNTPPIGIPGGMDDLTFQHLVDHKATLMRPISPEQVVALARS
jgi:methyltransferase family protein